MAQRLDPAKHLTIEVLLAEPRGFCAGVERAIEIVELALKKYGAPVYVRHEIVHNVFVVEKLKQLGAIFVKELSDIPDTKQPVIFSAHGVPQAVPAMARFRNLFYLDATCPLVSKVHRETIRHVKAGRLVILIGHRNHPEVIGTMGQVEKGKVILIETEADIAKLELPIEQALAYATQTTLSITETNAMITALRKKFPHVQGPKKEDICYATTNRQQAIEELAKIADYLLVVGSENSSNSKRLLEVGLRAGISNGQLINSAKDVDITTINQTIAAKKQQTSHNGKFSIALSAGASAPEELVVGVVEFLKTQFQASIFPFSIAKEQVNFKLPRELMSIPLTPLP